MADTGANLPTLPATVDLGGGPQIEGDPLEFMRKTAREMIESVNKNAIVDENGKIEFKKETLKNLKTNIDKFAEIDKKYEALNAEKAKEEGEKPKEEADPFADIFGSEGGDQPDEQTKEKVTIAGQFASDMKMYKEKFLKKARQNKENLQKKTDEQHLKNILGQLNNL